LFLIDKGIAIVFYFNLILMYKAFSHSEKKFKIKVLKTVVCIYVYEEKE